MLARHNISHWPFRGNARTAGLFVTHHASERIDQHFSRLRRESGHLIDWHMLRAGRRLGAVEGLRPVDIARCLPRRSAQMEENGGLQGGYLDVLVISFALATRAPFVWIMEYDVDFSGHWGSLFSPFHTQRTDFLTTTVYPRSETPDWHHWRSARAPAEVRGDHYHRAFNPIMRLSRRFALDYVRSMAVEGWGGHYEFTLATAALWKGFTVEDLGGLGPFCPKRRHGTLYVNSHADTHLLPGTFVWRPSLSHYFHERPNIFGLKDVLHHPIKPAVEDWEARRPVAVGASPSS